jgi:hypothetical protein
VSLEDQDAGDPLGVHLVGNCNQDLGAAAELFGKRPKVGGTLWHRFAACHLLILINMRQYTPPAGNMQAHDFVEICWANLYAATPQKTTHPHIDIC